MLPVHITSFVGRSDDLEDLTQDLLDPACRLLTLVGPGGIGKTRLAIELAKHVIECFSEDVVFVSLASATGTPDASDTLASMIADSLRILPSNEVSAENAVLDKLSSQEILLVLDNFESLIGGAELLSRLLQASPGLKLLVTYLL